VGHPSGFNQVARRFPRLSHPHRDLSDRIKAVLEKTRRVVADADALVTRTRAQNVQQRAKMTTMRDEAERDGRARAKRERKKR
jgi:hypothetical protein